MNEWGYWQREIAGMEYEKKETETKPELLVEGGCAGDVHSNTPYQRGVRKPHAKMKRDLIGLGGNKYKGGPYGDPSFERSLSAPPLGEGSVEEDKLIPKKGKIKIRIKAKGHDKKHIDVLEEI